MKKQKMKQQYLNRNWILRNGRVGELPATVPGCVHTDLIAGGVIGDLFWRDNNKGYQWIENEDWDYECRFDACYEGEARLVFEGLDTYAKIYLNGVLLGESNDMFIPHAFDVSGVLKPTDNALRVHFRSPIKEVEGLPLSKGAFTRERMHTRRLQCTYGWDWVDRFVTCGIFREAYLEYKNGIDVGGTYIYTESIDGFGAQICAELYFKNFDNGEAAHIEVISPDGSVAAYTDLYIDREKTVCRFDIADPQLWYPNGYGDQPLYTLKVFVGENLYTERFGIRTLKIVQLRDSEGSPYWQRAKDAAATEAGRKFATGFSPSGFEVVVNGEKIFCKGGNWVPCEPFPSEESDEKIRALVGLARDMGANFLRVWGGGLFEKRAFYDECDRCGILVAQDFLMACGNYPEDEEWFIDMLRKEAEYATVYLRNHPCLAWYHGDNENAIHGSDTAADYVGRRSALDGIAPAVYGNDHTRRLLPSSPYGGEPYACITAGTSHTTNFLVMIFDRFVYSDCADYKEYMAQFVSRFISEEGVFGAVCRPSMLRFMTDEDLRDESEEMLIYHTKNNPALKTPLFNCVKEFAGKVLGDFEDSEDKFFKYKYIQYEWTRVAFENVRRDLGYCNGIVFWMYNDCWPAALGWSLVDYYMLPKHAYYAFKRCAAHITGSVIPKGDGYKLVVSTDNQTHTDVSVTARLIRGGRVTKTLETSVMTAGYGTVGVDIPLARDADAVVVCDLEYDGGSDRCFYKDGALRLVRCDELLRVLSISDGEVVLRADGYIHAVELEGECMPEDNCFSMLEGETRTVRIGGGVTLRAYTLAFADKAEL